MEIRESRGLARFGNALIKSLGIRMDRVIVDRIHIPVFSRHPAVHHQHMVADLRHHTQVVGDQDHRQAEPLAQIPVAARGSEPGSSHPGLWWVHRR